MQLLENFKKDGSIYTLYGLFAGVVMCSILGAVFGLIKVYLFERSAGGKYAVYKDCVLWDDLCAEDCEQAQYDNPGSSISCESCCLRYDTLYEPLGERMEESVKLYAVYGGGIGFTIGLVIGEEIRKKKQK